MAVLIEKVNDDFYVNPLAVDYIDVERRGDPELDEDPRGRVVLHLRGGVVLFREWLAYPEAVESARGWQRLLNTGETAS
jgi:hypothetical protein